MRQKAIAMMILLMLVSFVDLSSSSKTKRCPGETGGAVPLEAESPLPGLGLIYPDLSAQFFSSI